jgi:hypothetical protein
MGPSPPFVPGGPIQSLGCYVPWRFLNGVTRSLSESFSSRKPPPKQGRPAFRATSHSHHERRKRLLSTPDRNAYWALNAGVSWRWRAACIASWWAWGRTVSWPWRLFGCGAYVPGGTGATRGPVKPDPKHRIAGDIVAWDPFDTRMPLRTVGLVGLPI